MSDKWNLEDLWYKIDNEGGLGEALFYFGREVNSESEEINEAWREAYDAIEYLQNLIPEPVEKELDEY